MNRQSAIALGAAVFIGLIAVFLANAFFSGVEQRQEDMVKQTRLTNIVVAAQAIEFGKPLTNTNVRLAEWPAGTVPAGAFTSLEDATRNRFALQGIAAGEPILASRISGADGRATMSVTLPQNQLAVAIPINDVTGVAGFIRPGDLVDVMLTRPIPGDGARADDKMVDVIMNAVPVLAIDQVADKAKTEPATGRTATLQVDTMGAQKLALARELGSLSLGLRSVASAPQGFNRTVLARDLSGRSLYIARRDAPAPRAPASARAPIRQAAAVAPRMSMPSSYVGPTMTVYRGLEPTQYEVIHAF